jgi:hypothetical protein
MISLLLMILAGILNAFMDVTDFHYSISIFTKWKCQKWIDPALSWRNKWKNGDPAQGERFFGSSTIFVCVTDFWHFCEFLMMLSICCAIVFYHPLIKWWTDIIFFFAAYSIFFEIFFSKILIRRKNI